MSDKNPLSKIAATAPEKIWLDLGEEAHLVEDETTFKDLAGVTWSEDNATGQGIKYLRADTLSHPATQAGALQAASHLVPGQMHCARCKFQLTRTNLYVNSGTVGAGDSKTERCPNGCGPLWPVTWEQAAREAWATCETLFERAKVAEDALAAVNPPRLVAATQPNAAPGDGQGETAFEMRLLAALIDAGLIFELSPMHHEIAVVEGVDVTDRVREAAKILAAPGTATAAREQEQRERMNVRFANRPASAATADFDLPAASDAVAAREQAISAALYPMERFAWTEEHVKTYPRKAAAIINAALASGPEAPAAPSAEGPTNAQIEAAAKAIAACMDYPWGHMPEQGRNNLRKHAKTVIAAAASNPQSPDAAALAGMQPVEGGEG